MKFTRLKAETDSEKDLLTGLIVSDRFCKTVLPVVKPHLIQVDVYKTIIQWVQEYFNQYDRAPGLHLEKIFRAKKDSFNLEDQESLGLILKTLSDRYEEKEYFNIDHYIDEAILYLKKQSLLHHSETIKTLVEIGDIDGAEKATVDYHKVAKATSSWHNPYDPVYIENYFIKSDEYLFQFPGVLGHILGKFKRKQFHAIMGPMKRGKCLTSSSLIPLSDGRLKTLGEIIENKIERVMVLDQNNWDIRSGSISKYFNNGIQKVLKVKTKTGREIKLTQEHPLLTLNGWEKVRNLKIGDRIGVPRNITLFGNKRIPIYEIKLISYLLAEGHIKKRKLVFTNKNPKIQGDFKEIVKRMGDSTSNKPPISLSICNKWKKKGVTSQTNLMLDKYEVKRVLSHEKEVPDIIFQLEKDLLKEFLAILFSCDGSIWKDREGILVSYSSSSKKLIDQVYHLLLRFGVTGKIEKKKIKIGRSAWEIIISNKENVLRYIRNIGFKFDKQQKALSYLKLLDNKKDGRNLVDIFPPDFSHVLKEIGQIYREKQGIRYRNFWRKKPMDLVRASIEQKRGLTRRSVQKIAKFLNDGELINLANSDVLWDEIDEIIDVGEEKTYDISIEKHHNFIADGFIVHNSFYLDEFRHIALLSRLKVAFISLEMEHEEVSGRGYKRVTGQSEDRTTFIYPVFDCLHNQHDTCKKDYRTNTVRLVDEHGNKPPFNPESNYRACTHCRGLNRKEFELEVWYERLQKPILTLSQMKRKARGVVQMYGDLYRIISHPIDTVNIKDIERDLDLLAWTEGFIPDVVIIDYADILRKEDSREHGRDAINTTWKTLRSLAQRRNCLVVTGTQSNRASIEKKRVKQTDTGEDIRKLAHVTSMMVLNQTPFEKRYGLMRIGLIAKRSEGFDEMTQVQVLQCLEMGQTHLDSEIYRGRREEESND